MPHRALCLLVTSTLTLGIGTGAGAAKGAKACSATAKALLAACRGEGADASGRATAVCLNGSEAAQADCLAQAKSDRRDQAEECGAQYDARLALCDTLGEERYDPSFAPADFVTDFAHPGVSNPYQPLAIGNTWDYESASETDHVEVTGDTKEIAGVTCLVVRDRVREDGELKEDTNDWFALAHDGDVWYCGEEAKDFETFAADDPPAPELVSIEGSFKAGREGDKPGVIVPAAPVVGQVLRQEFSVGNAEDVAEVLSTNYVFGADATLDEFVPQALADHLCGAGCVVTRESSPLEPDSFERKYYAPGIGVFLETAPDTGEVNRLVDCSFDARCETAAAAVVGALAAPRRFGGSARSGRTTNGE